jgi:antirestriction protein ArdC
MGLSRLAGCRRSAAVIKDYAYPFWLTFNQVLGLGSHVRNGESGELIVSSIAHRDRRQWR